MSATNRRSSLFRRGSKYNLITGNRERDINEKSLKTEVNYIKRAIR
jgi:hypothetical protein